MTRNEAYKMRDRIIEICREARQWVVVTEEHKPDTRKVSLEVSIKIDK